MNKQAIASVIIFAKHTTGKKKKKKNWHPECNELPELNKAKTSNPIKKWANCFGRHLTKEHMQMSIKHM